MTDNKPISVWHPAVIAATWFWSGLSPKAPGTMGSLAALPFGYAILYYIGQEALLLASISIFCLGILATNIYLKKTGKQDPGEVVIDEVAGQWIPLLIVGTDLLLFGLAFILFRLFDILKPWPISWLDRHIKGATGVMIDDIVAGLFALLSLLVIKQVL